MPAYAISAFIVWAALVAVVREGERDSKARGEFNAAITAALDALATPDPQKDGL